MRVLGHKQHPPAQCCASGVSTSNKKIYHCREKIFLIETGVFLSWFLGVQKSENYLEFIELIIRHEIHLDCILSSIQVPVHFNIEFSENVRMQQLLWTLESINSHDGKFQILADLSNWLQKTIVCYNELNIKTAWLGTVQSVCPIKMIISYLITLFTKEKGVDKSSAFLSI